VFYCEAGARADGSAGASGWIGDVELVDLNGHVVGLNIARSGRIECFAIPSITLVDLLRKVDTGKFSRPELEDLRKEVKNAETLLERVRKDAERLKSQLKEAEGN